jgi:hypothetical protein
MNPIPRKRARFSHAIFIAALLASTGSPAAAFLATELFTGLYEYLER